MMNPWNYKTNMMNSERLCCWQLYHVLKLQWCWLVWPSSEAVLSLVFRQTSVSMSGAGQTVDIKLSRSERQPWGFRLHGGADFGAPLIIQKVSILPFLCLLTLTLLWLDMKNWISWIKLCEILKFNLCKFWSSRLPHFWEYQYLLPSQWEMTLSSYVS